MVVSSYILIKENKLVNPGQYGIAVAGGSNISVINNQVYSSQIPCSNIGLYVWNQYSTASSNITVKENKINWINRHGDINDLWNAGNCGIVEGWNSNIHSASTDSTMLPKELFICK